MSMTHDTDVLKDETLQQELAEILAFVRSAAQEGQAVHDVERGLWRRFLKMGRATLGMFFDLQGDGDMGETVTLPSGETLQRLAETHERRYLSIYGPFSLE